MMVRLFHTQKGNCIDYEDQSYDNYPCNRLIAGVVHIELMGVLVLFNAYTCGTYLLDVVYERWTQVLLFQWGKDFDLAVGEAFFIFVRNG